MNIVIIFAEIYGLYFFFQLLSKCSFITEGKDRHQSEERRL